VCTVNGVGEYAQLVRDHQVPIVVSGFEPVDILEGILRVVRQLEEGRVELENQYSRVVLPEGNLQARALVDEVFEPSDRDWRGIGTIPLSGMRLREGFGEHDAGRKFASLPIAEAKESEVCISGLVLSGQKKPGECPAFGTACTPEHPLGATMVSAEGACAAYYACGRAAGSTA
jgi:hydrogenase expression/formation protein HypD